MDVCAASRGMTRAVDSGAAIAGAANDTNQSLFRTVLATGDTGADRVHVTSRLRQRTARPRRLA